MLTVCLEFHKLHLLNNLPTICICWFILLPEDYMKFQSSLLINGSGWVTMNVETTPDVGLTRNTSLAPFVNGSRSLQTWFTASDLSIYKRS